MKKIFILDTHKSLCNILKKTLETESNCHTSCFHSEDSLLNALNLSPDIILLDPNINTEAAHFLTFYNTIRKLSPKSNIILLSSMTNINLGVELLRNGVVNYIDKQDKNYLNEVKSSVNLILKIDDNQTKIELINNKLVSLKKKIVFYTCICLFILGISLLF